MNDQRGPPWLRSRSFWKIWLVTQKSRISCSRAGKSAFDGTGLYTRGSSRGKLHIKEISPRGTRLKQSGIAAHVHKSVPRCLITVVASEGNRQPLEDTWTNVTIMVTNPGGKS